MQTSEQYLGVGGYAMLSRYSNIPNYARNLKREKSEHTMIFVSAYGLKMCCGEIARGMERIKMG